VEEIEFKNTTIIDKPINKKLRGDLEREEGMMIMLRKILLTL
jgi:hypothetical protein